MLFWDYDSGWQIKKKIKYTNQIYNEMKSSKKIQEKPERRVPVEYIPKAR